MFRFEDDFVVHCAYPMPPKPPFHAARSAGAAPSQSTRENPVQRPISSSILAAALLCLMTSGVHAGLLEDLKKKVGDTNPAAAATTVTSSTWSVALSDEEVVRALKETLFRGTQQAVANLGRDGGFLYNLDVKIPLPDGLKRVEKLLHSVGQEKYADEFAATLNHAAEKAVPEAASIFTDALSQMSLADAKSILKGPDDAATQYFRKSCEARLKERFLPVVQAATNQTGVTSAYKKLMQKAGPSARFLGAGGGDLDGYVEAKAVDGLFRMIAAEEKRIRQEPVARTTDLLKKVFGAQGK